MPSAEVTAAFPREKKFSAAAFAVVTLVTVAGIIVAGYGSVAWGVPLTGAWGITIGFLVVFLAALGLKVHDRIGGALIDEQKLMSLSRFQLVAWTVLIVSTILVIGFARGFSSVDALNFTVPDALWQLLGITAGGAVGKEVVNAVKKRQTVPNAEVAAMQAAEAINAKTEGAAQTNMQEVEAHRTGMLYGNPTTDDASVVDMFQGVEIGNTAYVDMSKVQMFFFTIAALVAYGADVFHLLNTTEPAAIAGLPEIKGGLLVMLTISHATYLTAKSVDHTSASANDTAQAKANAMKAQPVDDPAEKDA